ncbi:hypothetical protein [Streptomyces sp. NPDC058718]|uniref:hypothetical protein n=1 Tax=Streptomyces sp. NPDC058718 TaxID=3346610 RepID=UPI0036872D10
MPLLIVVSAAGGCGGALTGRLVVSEPPRVTQALKRRTERSLACAGSPIRNAFPIIAGPL